MYWLDTAILVLLGVGAGLGAWTGLLKQVVRVVGLIASIYAAVMFHGWAANWLQQTFLQGSDPAIPDALSYVVVFVAIAWALSFRGQTVRLWFVLPVSSRGMVFFIVAMSFLRVVAAAPGPEGLLSPFGGMLAGWLLGAGTPSPLRRVYLKFRLAQLDREAARGAEAARARRQTSLS